MKCKFLVMFCLAWMSLHAENISFFSPQGMAAEESSPPEKKNPFAKDFRAHYRLADRAALASNLTAALGAGIAIYGVISENRPLEYSGGALFALGLPGVGISASFLERAVNLDRVALGSGWWWFALGYSALGFAAYERQSDTELVPIAVPLVVGGLGSFLAWRTFNRRIANVKHQFPEYEVRFYPLREQGETLSGGGIAFNTRF